jgi:hypothetical protein
MQLTQEIIRKHFMYDPITGVLQRDDLKKSVPIIGQYLSFKGKTYSTARIIHQFMIYEPPKGLVLRIDRDPTNNKWSNFTTTQEFGIRTMHKQSSAQKRSVELSVAEMEHIFMYDRDKKELWFLLSTTPTICRKHTLKFRWEGTAYIRTRAHIITRMKYIEGAKRSAAQGFELISPKSQASRAKRHATQKARLLRKQEASDAQGL